MRLIGPDGPIDCKVPTAQMILGNVVVIVDRDSEELMVDFEIDESGVWVSCNGNSARFSRPDGMSDRTDHEARAPMTGKVVSIPVNVGDCVKRGDDLAVLEAMKMEYRLEAEADGVVAELGAKEGELVDLGQLLVRLE
ncbi:MAG: acetyl-CoA carboxylase biotin carboxyl carrier protein subunit [Fimbriimonadales bacterium]